MIAKWKALSKKRKKLIYVLALLTLLVSAAGYTVFIAPLLKKEEWIYKEAAVEKGNLVVGVTESGSLEYGIRSVMYQLNLEISSEDEEEEEDSGEQVSRYLEIEEVYVKAGQRVEAGDALFKISQDSISDVRSLLKKESTDAASEYNEAEAEYELAVLEARTDYEISKNQGEYADGIYENGMESVSNQITALEAELNNCVSQTATLKENLSEAQSDYNDALETYEISKEAAEQTNKDNAKNYMEMQSIYMDALSKYQSARQTLTRAEESLQENEEKILSLNNELEQARAAKAVNALEVEESYKETNIQVDNARITYQAELESLRETLTEALDEKELAEEQLEDMEAFVGEDGIIYATDPGIITEVFYEAGDKLEQAGAMLSYAMAEEMTISVDVTQEDVVGIQVGDSVDIYFTAYEDIPYEGTIQSIHTTATSRDSNTISYEVVISVSGDTTKLYGGMTADVTFITEKLEDVLYISRKAIVEENGKQYVYKQTALGGKELVEVETGVSNGTSIQILSGLEEGETIYLASRVSSTEDVLTSGEEGQENTGSEMEMPEGAEMPGGVEMPEGMEKPEGGFGNMSEGGRNENSRP